ncbi:hypothetical protein [Nocardioides sp.]|uniref:hypothetical protein n=1 Tax=Nocardioides sp. TaxID=35761 RepID=UPI002ED0F638
MVKHLAEDKGLAAGSVRNIYDVTAALFAAAVEDRALAVSPCKKIRLPRGADSEVDVPTVEERSSGCAGRWTSAGGPW